MSRIDDIAILPKSSVQCQELFLLFHHKKSIFHHTLHHYSISYDIMRKTKGMISMKKIVIAMIILVIAGNAAWLFLLRPESVSQENLTNDFKTHRQAYYTVAGYLMKNKISADIEGILMSDNTYGIETDDSDEFRTFAEAVEEIITKEHDAIISDGKTVEFVYHSTGGKLRRLYGSVIYNGQNKVEGKVTVPLTTDGWHLYIAHE